MVDQLKKLTIKTKLTFYICQPATGKMHTIYEGKSFEGELPEWMANFVTGAAPLLSFEQKGQRKQYFKWCLNAENTIVFLDDPQLSGLNLILNNLIAQPAMPKAAEASNAEINILTEKFQQAKIASEKEARRAEAAVKEAEELKQQNVSLNEMTLDQSRRLKEALSQNLDLQKQLKDKAAGNGVIEIQGMSQARSVLTQTKDENARLLAQVRGWEEKYRKLEDQYNTLRLKLGHEAVKTEYGGTSTMSQGLKPIITALNKIIVTGDASGIDLEGLNLIISTPPKAELETSPESVKAVIAKLLGMERSGQLTSFQMKKLNNVIIK